MILKGENSEGILYKGEIREKIQNSSPEHSNFQDIGHLQYLCLFTALGGPGIRGRTLPADADERLV